MLWRPSLIAKLQEHNTFVTVKLLNKLLFCIWHLIWAKKKIFIFGIKNRVCQVTGTTNKYCAVHEHNKILNTYLNSIYTPTNYIKNDNSLSNG